MNKIFNTANLLRLTKASFHVAFSLIVLSLTIAVKILMAIILNEESSPPSQTKNHPYVLDKDGKEIIDDHVTYVYDFDDPINLKEPF